MLKVALEADADNQKAAQHLFSRLRTNTYVISAAVEEDLSSSNAALNQAIQSTICAIITTLAAVRDAVYRQLLANK